MALIKFGGGITAMSGSISGNTFARNRFGFYSRARTKPVNSKTPLQNSRRLTLAGLSEFWHETLSPEERSAWETYAAAISMKNRLGENVKCTGFNHFIRGNSIRLLLGQPYIEPGPTVLSMGETDPTFAITAKVSDQKIYYTFDETLPWHIEALGFMPVFMGRPQLVTRNFFNGPWKYGGQIVQADVSPKALLAPMTLVLGQKIWCYARTSRADARLSAKFVATTVVVA